MQERLKYSQPFGEKAKSKARSKSDPLISLLVPCYNEDEAIEHFVPAVDAALPGHRLEIIFINDGSSDNTLLKLTEMAQCDERLRVINLSRNFGKEAALTAGLDHAKGDCIVPIDADLQDPPDVILQFIEQWRNGYDVVVGLRTDRRSDTWHKRGIAQLFYKYFNKVADTEIPPNVGDFRLMDRTVVQAIHQLPERNRFMKGLFAWVGFPTTSIEYSRPVRSAGTTKFNFWRLWNFALDGIVGFSTLPLRIWTYIGTLVAILSLMFATYIAVETLIHGRDVPGYASIMTSVLFLGGIQLITLGVIGEYLARLFEEAKARPIYLVDGIYQSERSDGRSRGFPSDIAGQTNGTAIPAT